MPANCPALVKNCSLSNTVEASLLTRGISYKQVANARTKTSLPRVPLYSDLYNKTCPQGTDLHQELLGCH